MVVSKEAQPASARKFSVVAAACKNSRGIGRAGSLPWRLRADMAYFKRLTVSTESPLKTNAVIMGRKTWESIPAKMRPLPDRINVVVSGNARAREEYSLPDEVVVANSLEAALEALGQDTMREEVEKVFVIGGSSLYADALKRPELCDKLYLTEVSAAPLAEQHPNFGCDTFFPEIDGDVWKVEQTSSERSENALSYRFVTYKPSNVETSATKHEEMQYLDLVRDVIRNGDSRPDRTGVGTRSRFGVQMRFSLRDHFPLLTTKSVFWRGVAEELLWFVSGDTSAKTLQDKKIKIWDGNSSRDYLDSIGLTHREVGDLGPVYGWQWRHFGAEYKTMHDDYTGQGVDQIKQVIDAIKNKPHDRRIILSAWNPKDIPQMALPPCHMFAQFYVANGELSCQMYQRSADLGLGVPFNIASYALLTCLLAHVTGLKRGDFVHVIGDAHVYNNHIDALEQQLLREPKLFPQLHISDKVKNIEDCTFADLEITGYNPHGKIKMEMAV